MNPFNYGVKRLLNRFPIWVTKAKYVLKKEGPVQLCKKIFRKVKLFFSAAGDPHRLQNSQYSTWINNIESLYTNPEYTEKLKKYVGNKTKFSVLFPVWNKSTALLKDSFESILAQSYDNFEICISDGSTKDQEVTWAFLEEFAKANKSKVKLKTLANRETGVINIIENTNNTIKMAEGEYCVSMDCDDLLMPNCLLELALAIKKNPKVDFIYSDFDKADLTKRRFDPSFWPDWSPHTILSQMYTTHVTCYRTKLLNELGGLREGTAGAQDWDLVLRLTEKTKNIVHIPKILYHWMLYPGSTAMPNSGAKDWAYVAQKRVLEECIARRGYKADVVPGPVTGHWRVKFSTKPEPKVSIIVPFRDKIDYVKICVESILNKTEYDNYEIVLVNNQSVEPATQAYLETLKSNEKIKFLDYNFPYHFGRMNNWATTRIEGEYVLFLNNDIEIISGEWLSSMVEYAQLPDVGSVGAKLLFKNGTIQHAGIIVGITGSAAHAHRMIDGKSFGYNGWLIDPHDVSGNTGACLLINKKKFDEVGMFDESFDPAYQDVDLGLKLLEAGYYNVYTPYAQLFHYESVTRLNKANKAKLVSDDANAVKLREKWSKFIKHGYGLDLFYNPNLSYDHEDFRLKIVDTPEEWKHEAGLVEKL